MGDWNLFLQDFRNHLMLERSLSRNSIEAYTDDIAKLAFFSQSSLHSESPLRITGKELERFNKWIASSGLSAASQARIISGVRAFYQFLVLEKHITQNPAALLETPRLQRKLPEVLSLEEIDHMMAAID